MARAGKLIVTGDKEIDRKLKQLVFKVQRKVASTSMREGMKIVANETRSQTPGTGNMRSAVKVRVLKQKKRDNIGMEVRVTSKVAGIRKTSGGRDWYIPAIIEFGRRGVPPDPFMRRAYEAKGRAARDAALTNLLYRTLDEVDKL